MVKFLPSLPPPQVNRQRIPLSDNAIIQKALGKKGLICIEDLVHEIATVGPNFKSASNFLWPFKLPNPNGGWKNKGNHYIEVSDKNKNLFSTNCHFFVCLFVCVFVLVDLKISIIFIFILFLIQI